MVAVTQQQQQKQAAAETTVVGATKTSAEEEALKRNTDCVYFLASPLTCKKVRFFLGFQSRSCFDTLIRESDLPFTFLFFNGYLFSFFIYF